MKTYEKNKRLKSTHDVCMCGNWKLWICGKESQLPIHRQKHIVRTLWGNEAVAYFREKLKA